MKKTDSGLLFYSIGPDDVDNDGAPYNSNDRTGDITFAVAKPNLLKPEPGN